jgi:hypothetical protein
MRSARFAGGRMSQSEARLGDLLVERRLISTQDLDEALAAQKSSARHIPLGQVLIDNGAITRRQLHLLLEWTNKRAKIGELLIKAGAVDEAQVGRALKEQASLALPLG